MNQNDFPFSVLMSVYFKEDPHYFSQSINSLLKQTLVPNQIVIVCDGELTADLYEVISEEDRKNPGLFTVIKYPDNKGLAEALNIGLEKCRYELVARMDSDDISQNSRFELQVNAFKNDEQLCICGGQIEEFDNEPNDLNVKRQVPLSNDSIYQYAKHRNPFNHVTVMFKKSIITSLGGYESFHLQEDYHLWAKVISKQHKCCNLSQTLVYVRIGNGMYERRGGLQYFKSELKLQRAILDFGIINHNDYIINILSRGVVRLLPNKLRKQIYLSLLREGS